MKKDIIIFLIASLMWLTCALAFGAEVKFTVPDDKLDRVITAMKGLYPIPTDESGSPLYTDAQWAKEAVRRWIITQVQRYETAIAQRAITIPADNDIAQ